MRTVEEITKQKIFARVVRRMESVGFRTASKQGR